MSLEELLKMVLSERLDSIIKENCTDADQKIMEEGECVINSLSDQEKEAVQAYINVFLDREAESNEQAYLGGIGDTIWLLVKGVQMFMKHLKKTSEK